MARWKRWKRYWLSLLPLVLACELGCNGGAIVIPPCPVPTNQAIDQLAEIEETPLEHYVGQIERYCDAIEVLR